MRTLRPFKGYSSIPSIDGSSGMRHTARTRSCDFTAGFLAARPALRLALLPAQTGWGLRHTYGNIQVFMHVYDDVCIMCVYMYMKTRTRKQRRTTTYRYGMKVGFIVRSPLRWTCTEGRLKKGLYLRSTFELLRAHRRAIESSATSHSGLALTPHPPTPQALGCPAKASSSLLLSMGLGGYTKP